jgi:CubicO group peptidase (beta-lactamase class C family)
VAGELVAGVTHTPLARALHEYLLDPLHLTSTRYTPAEPVPAATIPLPSGYDNPEFLTAIGAAGAMVSSLKDLTTFGNAFLRNGSFLSPAAHQAAATILPGGTGAGTIGWGRGVGMCIFDPHGCPLNGVTFFAYGGSGNIPGAQSILLYNHDNDTLVAAFVNGQNAPVSVMAPLTWFHRHYRS